MLRGKFLQTIAVVSFISGGTAFAQPVPAGPDPQFIQNALAALQQQRNRALDEAAQAQAQLAVAQAQLANTKKELDDLKAKVAPKPAEPTKK